MAKWNRRQILSGLLAAVGADTTALTWGALAQASSFPVNRLPKSEGTSADRPLVAPAQGDGAEASGLRPVPTSEGAAHDIQRMLPSGLRFGRWRVVEVHPIKLGGVPVILEGRNGVRFQIDVLARDRRLGSKRGIAQTRHYSLHLANLGRGAKPTHEEHGLGVIWLAALLRTREGDNQPVALLTLRDRLVSFPSGRFDVLRTTSRSARSHASDNAVRSEAVPNNDHASALGLPASPFAAAPGLPKPRDGASNA